MAAVGTLGATAYLGVTAKWGSMINRKLVEAQDLFDNEFNKKNYDCEYLEDLSNYISDLEDAKNANLWQAMQYALGVGSPLSYLPSLPSPAQKPNIPALPTR